MELPKYGSHVHTKISFVARSLAAEKDKGPGYRIPILRLSSSPFPLPLRRSTKTRMLTRWRRWNLNYLTDHSRQLMRRRRHRDDSISSDRSRAARVPSRICPFEAFLRIEK